MVAKVKNKKPGEKIEQGLSGGKLPLLHSPNNNGSKNNNGKGLHVTLYMLREGQHNHRKSQKND